MFFPLTLSPGKQHVCVDVRIASPQLPLQPFVFKTEFWTVCSFPAFRFYSELGFDVQPRHSKCSNMGLWIHTWF